MAVFLSPGVFPKEVDLSVLPVGVGALRPAFIGTAKKGPLNEPILITTAQQFIETFGEPFSESYLGYAVLAYLEEGNSCYVLRVGVEYQEGMDSDLAEIAIDTSGANIQGWGRIPVFKGIDYGKIDLRRVGDGDGTNPNPVVFHAADIIGSVAGAGSTKELSDAYNDAEESDGTTGDTTATVIFTDWAYSGCLDEVFTIAITGDPTGTGPVDGATFVITDSAGNELVSGTFISATSTDETQAIDLVDGDGNTLGITFYIRIDSGEMAANDTIVFQAQPDNRELTITVDNGSANTYTMTAATHEAVQDLVDAINTDISGTTAPFLAVVGEDANGNDIPVLRTDNDGEWIQVTGSCAWCAEVGISQYEYDIPRSFLIGLETGPYTFSSANNRVVLDVIGNGETLQFDFSLPVVTNTTAAAVAAVIHANGVHQGDRYFQSFALTVPGGTKHVVVVTDPTNEFDQLKLQANFSYVQTLRFAEELGIQFPYTLSYRTFTDSRIELPESSSTTPDQPQTCDMSDPDYDATQCVLDTAYFENIVGYIVAKSPGTWVDEYTVSLEVFTEGFGDTAGRYKITVKNDSGITQDVVEDVTFDASDTRYIGNVVNEGSPLGGVNGNSFYQWESIPDYIDTTGEVRNPSPFLDKEFTGGANGIPTDAAASATELDRVVIGNSATSTGIYAFQNPESYDFNLLLTPGFSSGPVIAAAIQFSENRGDVLYLVDPPYGLRPQQVIDWHNGMLTSDLTAAINSSYGALYWSWLKVNDLFQGGTIWVPPSGHIAAVFARTERETETWFAPAGLNRGRLLSALDIEYNPTQGERDALYGGGNAVNAIVNFTQQGITVWGQRTLQRQSTALDRVNVRMLLIFLKKNLSRLLRFFVFEQNDSATRAQILNTINPFLADIAARRGLTAYNVVCDETNNTPERIDRNELWVSVFIKPTRVAEFIVLNLVVLRTGANFGAQEVLAAGGVVTQ